MDIKNFIIESDLFNREILSIPINKKFNLVSAGEGGNRHLYIMSGDFDSYGTNRMQNYVAHIWVDLHGFVWATIYNGNQKNKRMSDIVKFALAKNAKKNENLRRFEFSKFSDVEKVISDILLYA